MHRHLPAHAVSPKRAHPLPTVIAAVAAALLFAGCAHPPPASEPPQLDGCSCVITPAEEDPPRGPVDLRGEPLRAGYVGYMFLHRGGFGGVSAVIVEGAADGATVHVDMMDGHAQQQATLEQWSELVRHVESAGFWSMAEDEPGLPPSVRDGDAWILEGMRDGKRHRVIRWVPRIETGERGLAGFVGLGEEMMRLGKMRCHSRGCLLEETPAVAPPLARHSLPRMG